MSLTGNSLANILKNENVLNQIYNHLCKYVPILLNEKNSNFLHSKTITNVNNIDTFEGKLSCGGCCYVLSNFLKELNINTECMISKIYNGEYLEDHMYLMHNNIIIDPTYRQFFNSNENNEYTKYLYKDNSFLFVGTMNDLKIYCNSLINKYNKYHKFSLDNSILDYWHNSNNVSKLMDMDLVINKLEYAIKKDSLFNNKNHLFVKLNKEYNKND